MGQDENSSDGTFQSVLFVCTGNIFRSVTAEYALKARLSDGMRCIVGSAGIDARPQSVHAWVRTHLREKGADATIPNGNLPRSWSSPQTSLWQWGETTKSSYGNNLDATFPCSIRFVSATTSRFWICTK